MPTSVSPGCDPLPHVYRLAEGEQRGATASHPPRCVFVEVTNRCNLSCNTCPRTFVTYEKPNTLNWDTFVHIAGRFPDVERAVLHGIGEPLLNGNLPRFIRYLKARGATVLFNTNAVLLNGNWSRALISSGLDEMRVSLDAATPDTYALIRGKPLLDRVVENLACFTAVQHELSSAKPRVSIWMTAIRENIAELPHLVRLAARVGVPEVYVQRLVYYLDSSSSSGLLERTQALYGQFDARVERIVAEAEYVARELGVALRASGATDPRRSLAPSRSGDSRPWTACARPWTTAYVTANGNCLPCCISPFATVDYRSLIMGNIFERDFTQIWNGEPYQTWRKALLGEHPPKSCHGCGVHWSL